MHSVPLAIEIVDRAECFDRDDALAIGDLKAGLTCTQSMGKYKKTI